MTVSIAHIKRKVLFLCEVGAIALTRGNQEQWLITAVRLKRKDNKLLKEGEYPRMEDLSALPGFLPPGIPVSITINGKGVLLRRSEEPLTNPVTHFLPDSNPEEFYWDMYKTGNAWYVFIARKSLVDGVCDQLRALGYKLIGVHIGAGSIAGVLPFLKDSNVLVSTHSYDIQLENGEVAGIEAADHSEDILPEESLLGNLYFKNFYLPALGAALEGLIREIPALSGGLSMPFISSVRKELEWRRYFSVAAWFALLSLLGMLLVNYGLFSHYFALNRELGASQALVRRASQEEDALRGKVDSGYAYLDSLGWLKRSRHSYFMDRVAALLPGSIVLNGLSSNPPVESNNSEELAFMGNLMRISGTCDDPDDLNLFIGSLRNLEMVEKVTLKTYQYKKDLGTSQFTVEVMTR